jgi:hypothetical protein
VPGVGEQGHGIAEEAIDGFDHDEGDVQPDADGEGEAEAGRRVNMAMTVAMAMARTSPGRIVRAMIVMRVIMRGVILMIMPVMLVIVICVILAARFAVHRSRLCRDKDRPRRAGWIKGEMNRPAS